VSWAIPSNKEAEMEQFLAQYGVVMGRERSLPPPCPDGTDWQRWADTIGTYAGATVGEGILRIHDAESGHLGRSQIAGMFPTFSDRITPFAYDWLGRQFAVDAARIQNDEQLILMFEPGTGQALEIPFGLAGFLNIALVDMTDAVVASVFFEEWKSMSRRETSLARTDCVGYRVPLFLGGRDDTSNLEVVDLDVYWTLTAQLYKSTRQLSRGSMINSVDTEDH
jgi:hypothetical protein